MSEKIVVLGAGSWGTSIAVLLAGNGYEVTLWCFEQEVVDDIVHNRFNTRYLPGVELDIKICPTSSLGEALQGATLIFEALPIVFFRNVLLQAKSYLHANQQWVVLSKGIENSTLLLPSQIIEDVVGCPLDIAVLTGPNKALSFAEQAYSAAVLASKSDVFREKVHSICKNNYFKLALSDDMNGAQIGGALKNVLSILLGVISGYGYKENTLSLFLILGLDEMARFSEYFGGRRETIYGLAGLGDLMLGLIGEKTRNFKVGDLLGQGNSLSDISTMMDVLPEGINTIKSVYQMVQTVDDARFNFPIFKSAYDIVYEKKSIRFIIDQLFLDVLP